MTFTGFSSDQEGSIVYDGEKFIINNPDKVPENFDSGDKPVIYTRPPAPKPPAPTTPNKQPEPTTTQQQDNMLNHDINYVVAGVGEPKDKKKKKKRDALAAGSGEQAIAGFSEYEGIRDISEVGLMDFEPEEATSLTGYTAVSEGQRQHIDYLLSKVDDDLAWVALVVIKEYGLPSKEQYAEYMAQFAGSGLDDDSDQLALELLDEVKYSNWDALSEYSDDLPYLNERTQDYVEDHDLDLKTRDDLQRHIEEQLTELVPEFNNIPIDWDILNTQGLAQVYYAALQAARHQYSLYTHGSTQEQHHRYDDVSREINFVLGLFEKIAPTPLENLDVLIEEFGWGYAEDPTALAISSLRTRLEAVHKLLDRPMPGNWEDINDNPLLMANVLAETLPLIEEDQLTMEFLTEYDPRDFIRPEDDLKILTGTVEEGLDPSLVLFALSWVYPPAGYALTAATMVKALIEEDGEAAIRAAGGFALGRIPVVNAALKYPQRAATLLNYVAPPPDDHFAQAEYVGALLTDFQTEINESGERPEGWIHDDWEDYVNALDPAFGPPTGEKLMTALEAIFRTEIRRAQQNQQ